MRNQKQKRSSGCLTTFIILLIILTIGIVGVMWVWNNVKEKAAKEIMIRMIESQISDYNIDADISEIINNIPKEDIDKVLDIADDYISVDQIGTYMDLITNQDAAEIQQYIDENISNEDIAELEQLYEKYKDQILLE